MRNFKVSVRAGFSFMFIACLLILLGATSLWKMEKLRADMVTLQTNSLPGILAASRMSNSSLRVRLELRRLIVQTEPQARVVTIERLKGSRDDMLKQSSTYALLVDGNEESMLYQAISSGVLKLSALVDTLIDLSNKNAGTEVVAYADTNLTPVTKEMEANIESLIKLNMDQAKVLDDTSSASYQASVVFTLAIIAGTLFVTVILAVLLTRSIVVPLKELLVINTKIASGDLRSEVRVSGRDEFSDLQRSTQAMQLSLRRTISMITNSSTQLASAAEEMNSITTQSRDGLSRQNQEIEQAATAVNEMTAAVDEVARNASAASNAARGSNDSTLRGSQSVTSTVNAIEKLSATVLATSTNVQRLAGQSNDISKVLAVIRTIAEQTNLLALNAAIEAARAGEQGRGFAVVADEVRALAHRTQQSTQEIEQMMGAILGGSEQATKSMQESCLEAQDTLGVAQEAGAALIEIARGIQEINDMNTLIATASEEQAQVARSIDHNLVSIRDLSVQSTDGAHQTALASTELSRLALEMNVVVMQFKI